ncbi:E3 ubiquitin-protein ligase TRIM35-like [Megalobrama amblycephala]|uniref:E3 ubiquitin-protein ligase TRIM35-like n=1 Tax=Megalobrama amblycephala TaxID=75352 RepID=UPI002014719E|nr:E3 ubiquitin-protein ligase TRIM35-like [Megalobrama amblycephala]
MASSSFFEEDLSCPVCLDIFRNPVVLSCSHSFCEHCIQRFWRKNSSKTCPVCRKESSHKHPQLNLALRNLCETYQQERIQKSPSGVCSDHNEKLKLFCLDDQQLVCLVCRDSRKHSNHRFCPVDEVAMDNKKELGYSLGHLQKKLRIFMNFKQTLDQTAQQIKIQTQDTEIQINREFEKLHQFLRKEEAARIKALREEEKQKSQKIKQKIEETTKQISSLTNTIRDIEKQMKAEDVSFLQNFKSTLQRAQIKLPDPQNITEMISVPKHLSNLKLTVLQKMQDNMKTSDVNTHAYRPPLPPRNFNKGGAPKPILHNFNRAGAPRPSPSPLPPTLKPILHNFNRAGAPPPSPSPLPPTPPPILHNFNRAGEPPPPTQNCEIQFPGVKSLVKKINEQMRM